MGRVVSRLTLCGTASVTQVAERPAIKDSKMNMKCRLAALPLIISLAMTAAAHARASYSRAPTQGYEIGREVAAPPWSAACMTDHGPSECDEPMWVYDSPGKLSRYRSAF
jgi:hypothetical protein